MGQERWVNDLCIKMLDENVYEMVKFRLCRVYMLFDYVVVFFFGGKDSFVCLQLCWIVLDELGWIGEKVVFFFCDEEVIQ